MSREEIIKGFKSFLDHREREGAEYNDAHERHNNNRYGITQVEAFREELKEMRERHENDMVRDLETMIDLCKEGISNKRERDIVEDMEKDIAASKTPDGLQNLVQREIEKKIKEGVEREMKKQKIGQTISDDHYEVLLNKTNEIKSILDTLVKKDDEEKPNRDKEFEESMNIFVDLHHRLFAIWASNKALHETNNDCVIAWVQMANNTMGQTYKSIEALYEKDAKICNEMMKDDKIILTKRYEVPLTLDELRERLETEIDNDDLFDDKNRDSKWVYNNPNWGLVKDRFRDILFKEI